MTGTKISWILLAATVLSLLGTVPAAADDVVQGDVLLVDREDGTAYLGVRVQDETERSEGGVRITEVVESSPADEAGLRAGDVVVRFDGEAIRGPVALTSAIQKHKPGDTVPIVVLRDGEERTFRAELGSRFEQLGLFGLTGDDGGTTFLYPFGDSEEWAEQQEDVRKRLAELGERLGEQYADPDYWGQFVAPEAEGSYRLYANPELFLGRSRPKLGVQLVETTPELREHLGGSEDAGVLVSKVLPATPAERYGVEVGDLIVAVDGRSVSTPDELVQALADKAGKTFGVELVRKGRPVRLEVTIPDPSQDRPTGPRA